MDLVCLWGFLRFLSDQWAFTAGLWVALALLSRSRKLRHYLSPLLLPAFLLLARKIALYVPVPGAISTTNDVLFWSLGAYVFAIIMLGAGLAAIAALAYWRRATHSERGAAIAAYPTVYAALLIASGICLPVDGLAHLYMPAVFVLSEVKLLVVSPALLPLAWLFLALQLVLTFTRSAPVRPEVNKLLVACLLVVGLVGLALQPVRYARSSLPHQIEGEWRTDYVRDLPATGHVRDPLRVWVEKLPEIQHIGINVVEKALPFDVAALGPAALEVQAAPVWTNWWTPDSGTGLAAGIAAFLFLMLFVEHLPLHDRRPAAGPGGATLSLQRSSLQEGAGGGTAQKEA